MLISISFLTKAFIQSVVQIKKTYHVLRNGSAEAMVTFFCISVVCHLVCISMVVSTTRYTYVLFYVSQHIYILMHVSS